jgi:hypothetical protein
MKKKMSLEEMKEAFIYINWGDYLYFYAEDHDEADKIKRRHKKLEEPDKITGILIRNDRYDNTAKKVMTTEYYSRMKALVNFELQTIEFIEE